MNSRSSRSAQYGNFLQTLRTEGHQTSTDHNVPEAPFAETEPIQSTNFPNHELAYATAEQTSGHQHNKAYSAEGYGRF